MTCYSWFNKTNVENSENKLSRQRKTNKENKVDSPMWPTASVKNVSVINISTTEIIINPQHLSQPRALRAQQGAKLPILTTILKPKNAH